ncbi:hypothetical protein A1Q1_01989 [Trichosporon asahii var. asahii CBS 2479]|uniref:Uncharacterized protein n=1 Tax=Trichosporon asahii var. asahii (strain ATCC 90039 / CBS 2479 / JCM 2466 / KCTC 7840 / NBRC 103889/ NCYC 2677 / UAMH 7654) TaxID=1186058 RepID=J6EW93_TRIAS|nr:hypothetical protein A1Q1_01989 [Trichosporon asahii var. asahii CBS 2479]EJT48894.1 hypothetical protein A1Q1_01989 [Trichosporon asahii var. asahii CBS 2479]
MSPPTQVTYRSTFEPFTTDGELAAPSLKLKAEYMYPEAESWRLSFKWTTSSLKDNVSSDAWSQADPRLNPTLMGSSQHFWFTTFLPRIAFLTHRRVTSEEVDGRLGQLITNMLYMFHVHVTDPQTGSRYAVGQEILEAVRAIRDTRAIPWSDEHP